MGGFWRGDRKIGEGSKERVEVNKKKGRKGGGAVNDSETTLAGASNELQLLCKQPWKSYGCEDAAAVTAFINVTICFLRRLKDEVN